MPRAITECRPAPRRVLTVSRAALVVTLVPEGIRIREHGRRKTFLLPYGVAYQHAVMLAVPPRRARRVRRGLL
jgi:hypothetical protein